VTIWGAAMGEACEERAWWDGSEPEEEEQEEEDGARYGLACRPIFPFISPFFFFSFLVFLLQRF
jgi:hypothetical protein